MVKMMDLKEVSTEELLKELKKRKEIQSYQCGIYQEHMITLMKKYDHKLIELPSQFETLIFVSPN